MKNIKELAHSTVDKLSTRTTSPISKEPANTNVYILPEWLITLFRMFTVNYKNLWTEFLYNEQMRKSTDYLWLSALNNFSREVILKTGEQVIITSKYPPTISDFLEIATALQRKEKFDNEMTEREKQRLLEKQPNREIAKKYIAQIKAKLNSGYPPKKD